MRIRETSLVLVLSVLSVISETNGLPAPALVTLWQTITRPNNDPAATDLAAGLFPLSLAAPPSNLAATAAEPEIDLTTADSAPVVAPTAAAAPVVPAAAAAPAAPAAPAAAAPVSPVAAAAAAAPASSSAFDSIVGKLSSPSFWEGLLSKFLGSSSAASSVPAAAAPVAAAPTTPAAQSSTPAGLAYVASFLSYPLSNPFSAPSPAVAASPVSSVFTSSTTSDSTAATETGGLYDQIADSPNIDKQFAKDILDAHNKYRAQHQVGPLSWETTAYNYAQNNANNYDCSGILTHTHGPFGENLAAGFPDGPSAVTAWYVEGETYNYEAANTYDHFTQLVWKGSTKVGCAYKDCRAENWGLYIICSYDPPGNFIGENKANVFS